MLAVTDVYCLINRLRGTDLVSPEDVLQACRLGQFFHVAALPSGILVVRDRSLADANALTARVLHVIASQSGGGGGGGVNALELAAALHFSVPIAEQVLLQSEQTGALCRDEHGHEGLRYWPNFFV